MRSNDSLKIIVIGISKTLDDAALSELFNAYGGVADAKVVRDATTNMSRGFGFVTFTAQSGMKRAVRDMNKKVVDGRTLNVRELVAKDKFQAKRSSEALRDAENDPSKRPCWMLRKGKCTKGARCPFSHELKSNDFGSCFEFAQSGSCKRGDNCKFYHPSPEEVGAASASVTTTATKPASIVDPNKPRMCFAFQRGRCHRGSKCAYLHHKMEVVEAPPLPVATSKGKVTPAPAFEVVDSNSSNRKRRRPSEEEEEEEEEEETESEDEDMEEVDEKKPIAAPTKAKPLAATVKQIKTETRTKVMTEDKPTETVEAEEGDKKVVHLGPVPVCRHFLKGRCKRGKICFFPHQRPKARVDSDDENENENENEEDTAPLQALADFMSAFEPKSAESTGEHLDAGKSITASWPAPTPMVTAKKEVVTKQTTAVPVAHQQDWFVPHREAARNDESHRDGDGTKSTEDGDVRPFKKAKHVKKEKIDMGAAFDGASDDERDHRRSRPVVDKEQLRAKREKLKAERREKRSAKKKALTRLQGSGEIELE